MVYTFIITIVLIAYAILAWRNLRVALITLAGLLPVYLLRFDVGPIPTTALEVMILIAFVVWVMRGYAKTILAGGHTGPPLRPWMLPGLLLLAAACFGVVVAPDSIGALGIWKAYFVEPLLVFVILVTTLKKGDWEWIVRALAISALVVSIVAITQWLTGFGIPTPWDLERRVTGVFEYPNALGLYLVPIVTLLVVRVLPSRTLASPACGHRLWRGGGRIPPKPSDGCPAGRSIYANRFLTRHGGIRNGKTLSPSRTKCLPGLTGFASLCRERSIHENGFSGCRRLLLRIGSGFSGLLSAVEMGAIFLGLIAIILAKTEAAYIAIPAALLITLLMSNVKPKIKWRVAGEALLILILIAAFVPTAREKLFLQDSSGQVRLSQWAETWHMLGDHPAVGAGLNAYPAVIEPYHYGTLYEIYQYPHTLIFNIWSELGLLGLIAFFWLAWFVIRAVRSPATGTLSPATLPIFAALAAMTIHGLVDVPYFKNDLAVLTWVLIAGLALQVKTKTDPIDT